MTVHGWRGRVGYIRPVYHAKDIDFWNSTKPEGVSLAPVVLGYVDTSKGEFESGLTRAAELARELASTSCDIIAALGTPPFLMAGPERELEWAEELGTELGVPIATAMHPHLLALRAMGIKRPLVATYYREDLNAALEAYLGSFGLKPTVAGGFVPAGRPPEEDGGMQSAGHLTINDAGFEEVYRHCKRAFLEQADRPDGIYINGSGWDAAPAVAYLEHDLGVPVIWAQHALSWYVYRMLDINNWKPGLGRLYAEWPQLPGD